jgi:phosphoribosylformimino-5-aminoimidazole carboxamide ribotide isomerase
VDLYPSIDLRGGKCVRLVQGDFDRETVYGDDPIAVAKHYAAAGATWIHVVDLDAARRRGADNRDLVLAIAAATPARVQVGGGITDVSLLDEGVERVVFGSLALSDPAAVRGFIEAWSGRVAVAADHWAGDVRDHAWETSTGLDLRDFVRGFDSEKLGAFLITDVQRDGMLAGPDVDRYREIAALSVAPVLASGGVSSLDDLRALADTGVAGAIVGTALYEGRFTIDEALAASAR